MVPNVRVLDAIAEETEHSGSQPISSEATVTDEMSDHDSTKSTLDLGSLATKEKRSPVENLTVILLMILNFRSEFIIYLVELVLTVLPEQLQHNFRMVVGRTILIVPDLNKIFNGLAKIGEYFILLGVRIVVFCTVGWIFFWLRWVNYVLEIIAVEVFYVDRWNSGIKEEDSDKNDE